MREPLYRQTFDAATLLKEHPPQFDHPHKQALFDVAYPDGTALTSRIDVTRWAEALPDSVSVTVPMAMDVRPDFFDYKRVVPNGFEWHVNFADPRLFVAYGSRLFAQDEMQVAEHPLLGSIREALLGDHLIAETTDARRGTPILIRHVERRLEISTKPDAQAGRPYGIYGNRFAATPFEVIRRATRKIDPPTISNIIAIAAPSYGRGAYSKREIESIFLRAFTGFSAARHESVSADGSPAESVVVHTGFWGCGAFGGSRNLMISMQVLAARAAKIRQLVFHAGDQNGVADVQRGLDVVEALEHRCGPTCSLDALVTHAFDMGFRWGVSDGN